LFHHFRLQQQLGRGATATVYRAVDERTGSIVALKLLSLAEDWPDDLLDEAKLRLLREAEAAGSLAHPDIVEIREAGEREGQVYLAMEYVEGVNLATHATEGRMLPPRLVCEMCARVADALYFAHQRGVIHRDIKPANIVFDQKNRRVRVMDFGVARLENSRATRTGVILGSPSYMAPEQLDARPVTPQSDLFSLGVSLFQLLTGMLPFRSDSIPGLMQKISGERGFDPTEEHRREGFRVQIASALLNDLVTNEVVGDAVRAKVELKPSKVVAGGQNVVIPGQIDSEP
jgi:serine/threonine-protein kinase